ncbi:MAG: hypothetical protein V4653_13275, partial [Pseudomonadota bacterium]
NHDRREHNRKASGSPTKCRHRGRHEEAAELVRGYCCARHPTLPATAHAAPVDYVLMSLQLLRPAAFTVERDGREYRKVAPHALAQHIGYVFRFDERGRPFGAASLKEDLALVPRSTWPGT